MLPDPSKIDPWLNHTFACPCGMTHVVPLQKVVIEPAAIRQLAPYLREAGYRNVLIAADLRTLEAAGREALRLLKDEGLQAGMCLLDDARPGEVVADEASVVQLLTELRPETQAVIAVGSGTIHDIVRFVCHRANRAFISLPTAPSVDGFASVGAPLILRGFKQTIGACPPEAIFADLDVLTKAPQAMIAAGFGDMLGKYTSLADWELGHALLNEHQCPLAARMTEEGLRLCVENAEEIARATKTGIRRLMEGLVLSGISMLMLGHSRPASGAEHHLSHYWEMRFIQQDRRALLHGAKVGASCLLMAERYERLRTMSRQEAEALLSQTAAPDPERDKARIREAYGPLADQVIKENFPANSAGQAVGGDEFKSVIAAGWDEIRRIAETVPAPAQLAAWLASAGGPTKTEQLGIEPALVDESLRNALFVRNRFTVLRLQRFLEPASAGR